MKEFIRYLLVRTFPAAWAMSAVFGLLFLAWFLLAPTEGMTGRKGADLFAIVPALGFIVLTPVLFANRNYFGDPE